MRRIVLLPDPDGPRKTHSSPSPISSDTSRTTECPAYVLVRCSRTIDTSPPGPKCTDPAVAMRFEGGDSPGTGGDHRQPRRRPPPARDVAREPSMDRAARGPASRVESGPGAAAASPGLPDGVGFPDADAARSRNQ